MIKNERLYWIIGVLVLVLFIAGIFLFRKSGGNSYAEKTLRHIYDSTINSIEHERDDYIRQIEEINKDVATAEKSDSLLNQLHLENQLISKKLDAKLSQIPIYISTIGGNKDSIRSAFRKF